MLFRSAPNGLRMIFATAIEFFSGAVIPLPFFPERIRALFSLLPFASMQNTPFLVYSGSIEQSLLVRAVLLQVFWLVVLVAIGWWLGSIAERKVKVLGG